MTDSIRALNDILYHNTCVQTNIQKLKHELERRMLNHDKSKLLWSEFEGVIRLKAIARTVEYGSEEYFEGMKQYKPAIDLHYDRNSHHSENHQSPQDMGFFDLVEMACDWYGAWQAYKAAGERETITWEESMEINHKRFDFTSSQWFVIESVLEFLVE